MKYSILIAVFAFMSAHAEVVSRVTIDTKIYKFDAKEVLMDVQGKKTAVPRDMVINKSLTVGKTNKVILDNTKFTDWYFAQLSGDGVSEVKKAEESNAKAKQ